MITKELKISLRDWLNENGYDDFEINCLSDLKISGNRLIPGEDIKKIKNELNIKLNECKVSYSNPFEKDDVKDVVYKFKNPSIAVLENEIKKWLNKYGLFSSIHIFGSHINLYSYSEISKDLICEFENEFNVELDEVSFFHKPSSDGCVKDRIKYKFSGK